MKPLGLMDYQLGFLYNPQEACFLFFSLAYSKYDRYKFGFRMIYDTMIKLSLFHKLFYSMIVFVSMPGSLANFLPFNENNCKLLISYYNIIELILDFC